MPGGQLHFLVAWGPDEQHPNGPNQADLASAFADFTGAEGNALVTVTRIPALRDLAVVLQHARWRAGNTHHHTVPAGRRLLAAGVGLHAGASRHRAGPHPSPFTRLEVEATVLWNRTDVINAIPPEALAAAAIGCLAA
ncbi:MAG: hypothetical protein ABI068_15655, partial [Ktedonobacterales bacterium]